MTKEEKMKVEKWIAQNRPQENFRTPNDAWKQAQKDLGFEIHLAKFFELATSAIKQA